MHFKKIVDDILTIAGQGTGGDAEDLVKNLVNSIYLRVMEELEGPGEEREFTFASVANQSQYGLPLFVKNILNIEDPTTPRFVRQTTARAFDKAYPGTTETGTPSEFYVLGSRGTQALPSSDGTLTVESSSAADAGANYKVRIEGFDTTGNLVSELVTMNGTSTVATTNSYDNVLGVERIVKAPASGVTFAGTVTLKDNAGNTIATIPVSYDSPDYVWIEFYPIPGAAITYTVRCEMRVPPLVNDFDWPKFDANFHDILIWGVTQDLLVTWGKPNTAAAHRLTFENRLEELLGSAKGGSTALWVFSNVQSASSFRQRPRRPLIKGVDFGLA